MYHYSRYTQLLTDENVSSLIYWSVLMTHSEIYTSLQRVYTAYKACKWLFG